MSVYLCVGSVSAPFTRTENEYKEKYFKPILIKNNQDALTVQTQDFFKFHDVYPYWVTCDAVTKRYQ